MWYFLSQKVDGKDDIYWLLKSFCFELFGDGKYNLFFSQKVGGWWYLLGIFELSMIFQDLGNTVFRAVQMAVSICRYQSLSHSPPHQNFRSYFLVFGKCGVTPYRLYSDSLTLSNKQLLSNCRTFMNLRAL